MAEQEVCTQLMQLLRLQRHDFINHLQVIHALLQLGRVEKALQYMEELSKGTELLEAPLAQHKPQACCPREIEKRVD
jgi:pentatricopeptide repeat protein